MDRYKTDITAVGKEDRGAVDPIHTRVNMRNVISTEHCLLGNVDISNQKSCGSLIFINQLFDCEMFTKCIYSFSLMFRSVHQWNN